MQANCKSKAMQVWQSPLNYLSMQTCLCVCFIATWVLIFYFILLAIIPVGYDNASLMSYTQLYNSAPSDHTGLTTPEK